ncbi:hypothetical protein KMS84_36530, partial [Streptomyces sp. IBSBF 2807]|nr:hypothetical protein [Streptomyces hilarionis]
PGLGPDPGPLPGLLVDGLLVDGRRGVGHSAAAARPSREPAPMPGPRGRPPPSEPVDGGAGRTAAHD